MDPGKAAKLFVYQASYIRIQMDRKNHFDIIELVDQLFQRLTYRAQRRSVILSAMSGHKQYAHTIVINAVETLIVERLCGRDRLQCVNNRVAGNEDAVLGHSVTGNTIVDALQSIPSAETFDDQSLDRIDYDRMRVLLVTAHRRENHGAPLRAICQALKQLVDQFDDIEMVFPVHLNPNVRSLINEELSGFPRIHLIEPTSYRDLLGLMRRCYLILTDSGGIQEESVSFHKPVLVLREVTERPEVVEVGAGLVIGVDTERIVQEVSALLNDPEQYQKMSSAENPFGDGHAAGRIVKILAERLPSEMTKALIAT